MSILRLVAAPGTIERGQILLSLGRGNESTTAIDLVTLPEAELRKIRGGRIGMIFQEPMTSLNPVFTIGSQITESLHLPRPLSRAAGRACSAALPASSASAPSRARSAPAVPGNSNSSSRARCAGSCLPVILVGEVYRCCGIRNWSKAATC